MKSAARSLVLLLGMLGAAALLSAGCASNDAAKKDAAESLQNFEGAGFKASRQGEYLVESYTLDGGEEPNLIKYFEEYPDPDNPELNLKRLRKKEVDVNSDGTINIVRLYDQDGVPIREKVDSNLDGTFDTINYYDNGQLVRKELLSEDESEVLETRFYSEGTIIRVERDRTGDGKVDYWEYYEDGILDRVGQDLDADGRADTWTRR